MTKREISVDEQLKIDKGLQRWWSEKFPSNCAPIYNMLSNPIKETIIYVVFIIFVYMLLSIYYRRSPIYLLKNKLRFNLYMLSLIIFYYVVSFLKNKFIISRIPNLPENPTYGDYSKKHFIKLL
jgi:hypothetical protein